MIGSSDDRKPETDSPQAQLRARTKRFALRILKLFRALPRIEEGRIIGRQLLRSGTSVAANYRAAGRARSRVEFAAKIGTVVEEADETVFWLEFAVEAGLAAEDRLRDLLTEANELLKIFSASQRTARSRKFNHPMARSSDILMR